MFEPNLVMMPVDFLATCSWRLMKGDLRTDFLGKLLKYSGLGGSSGLAFFSEPLSGFFEGGLSRSLRSEKLPNKVSLCLCSWTLAVRGTSQWGL